MLSKELLPERVRNLLPLLPYLRPYRRRLLAGGVMVLLTNLAAVASPWILRAGIDHLTQEIRVGLLVLFASLIVGVCAVEGVFRFLMRKILIGVSRYVEYDLRNAILGRLQALSPTFYQAHPTGDIMARSTNDLNAVRMVLGPAVMYSMNTVLTAILVTSVLMTIHWKLALMTIVPLLGVSASVKFFGKRIHARFTVIQERFSDLNTLVQENISGMRVVKAYGQEGAFMKRFEETNQRFLQENLSMAKLSGVFHPLLAALVGLSTVVLLWFGGRLVAQGAISLGDFVAFIAYIGMLTWPTIALGWVINVLERGSASMARINRLLETVPDVRDLEPRAVDRLEGHVRVEGLTFAYNGTPVLEDISFEIEAGQTLGIVGATGSGKSTLANLLCRLRPVPEGTVWIDGNEINSLPLSTLRAHIGYVPQDSFLFSSSVAENIAFGRPEATPDALGRVARVGDIDSDIRSFPAGYQTFVGERGLTLSGGQKQRLTIARALLVDPRIVILDDALSAVDTHTEDRILRQLRTELTGRTALIISHRISTIKAADQILVLKGGRIVERGRHESLLSEGGLYARLYEKQLLKEELGVE